MGTGVPIENQTALRELHEDKFPVRGVVDLASVNQFVRPNSSRAKVVTSLDELDQLIDDRQLTIWHIRVGNVGSKFLGKRVETLFVVSGR